MAHCKSEAQSLRLLEMYQFLMGRLNGHEFKNFYWHSQQKN